jgi:hypothetical protein
MRLNDSQWVDITRLVIDNMEMEIDIIREAGSSYQWNAEAEQELTTSAKSEIEGIKRLGKTLISEIRQIPMEGD